MQTDSLLRYDNPMQTGGQSAKPKDAKAKTVKSSRYKVASTGADAKAGQGQTQVQTEVILNSMLPPRYLYALLCHVRTWDDNGTQWEQKVSCTPATRNDVVHLQVRSICTAS